MFERKTAITIREIRGTIREPSPSSLKSHYNGRRVSRKEQRTAAVATAVLLLLLLLPSPLAATFCALINRLRYRKTYFRR
ncbi:hypothetical protein V1478_017322 [Vespula squamosa]|uniref:Uncharacterized protein n=1 Tax=Vespula squamosa TaxID=30214 RepID=A0ABD1ZXP1_VESSQ